MISPSCVPDWLCRRCLRVSVLLSALLFVGVVAAEPLAAEEVAPQKRAPTERLLRKIEKSKKNGGKPGKRFDQPAEAQEFFLKKRSPDGLSPISAQQYLRARDQMKGMPVYSTATGTLVGVAGDLSPVPSAGTLGAWQPLGPGNVGGRTRALVIHPTTPSTMYAGGVAGGVWRSTDAGASWQPLSDLMANIAVSTLAMTPGQPAKMYAGTGEGFFNGDAVRGAGIFKTIDGGATWVQLTATATPDFHYVSKIVVSPNAPQRLYAATRTGVHRSIDGGTTWAAVRTATTGGGFTDMVIRTDSAADFVFASEGNSEAAKVYRNTDAGGAGSWDVVLADGSSMGRTSLALAPSSQDVVYALSANNAAGNYRDGVYKVFRSTTGGASGTWSARWTQDNDATKLGNLLLTNPVYANLVRCGFGASNGYYNQGWYDNVIAVDPTDPDVVWTGGIDLFRSTDGGLTWGVASHWWFDSSEANYNHADHHAIVFHPGYDGVSNQVMYVGNDGGIHRTENARTGSITTDVCGTGVGTLAWADLNNGYGVTQFYHGAVYPDGLTFFGGTQDNGTVRGTTVAGPNAWTTLQGGDGGYTAVDPTNTQVLYAEYTGLSIQKSTNGGTTWASATTGISDSGFLFIAPFTMDPSNAQTLWTGGWYPWRTTSGATSWTRAGGLLPGDLSASAVAVAPTDSNYVLFGMSDGYIARSSTALTTTTTEVWPSVRPRTGYCSSVTFDPANKNVAYATYSTFGGVHVWKSTDSGATWTSIDGAGVTGIPDVPAHSVAIDPTNTLRLYVGTDLGVFVSNDGGANWSVENTGFANVVTETLATKGSHLYSFTHGRGAFRVALADPPCALPPTATVSGSTSICPGQTAVLSTALTGTGPWDVTWSDGATQLAVASSPAQRTVSPASTSVYTVTQVVSEAGGCVAAGTGSATVTVIAPPATPVITAPASAFAGAPFTASVPAVAGVNYTWTVTNGTVTAGAGTQQITLAAGETGFVTISVTETSQATGCTSGAASVSIPVALGATRFYPVTPCRLFDTREAGGASAAAPALGPGETRTFNVGTRCGLDVSMVRTLSVNQTVALQSANGELAVYRGDLAQEPITSNISYQTGKTRANNGLLELSRAGDGSFKVHNRSTGSVDFILDVNGVFR